MPSVSLSPPGILQFFDNRGLPNVGGTLLTQVGGVNYATYQDSGGTTALPNPIPLNSRGEISNAAGASQQLFLVLGVTYTCTLYDVNGNQLDSFTLTAIPATGATDISGLQAQITALGTSITTGTLTVTGATTLHAVTAGAITSTGASSFGATTLGGNLAMGSNSITGAVNITASGTISAGNFATTSLNAASFLSSAATTTGTLVNFDTNGTSSGSGITNSAGTITFANAGTYDVTFSGIFKNPTAATNIDTGLFFGGTANLIVGPVTGNTQRMEIAGANGAVFTGVTMRAIVVTSAVNQTLNVSSAATFGATYQADARCYIVISQR